MLAVEHVELENFSEMSDLPLKLWLPVQPRSYFTGITTGASLSLSKITTNLAGIVLLAFRPTV
jgi:hypothetical protein